MDKATAPAGEPPAYMTERQKQLDRDRAEVEAMTSGAPVGPEEKPHLQALKSDPVLRAMVAKPLPWDVARDVFRRAYFDVAIEMEQGQVGAAARRVRAHRNTVAR